MRTGQFGKVKTDNVAGIYEKGAQVTHLMFLFRIQHEHTVKFHPLLGSPLPANIADSAEANPTAGRAHRDE